MTLHIPPDPNYFVVTTLAERNAGWHDGSLCWVRDESKLYVLDTGSWVEVTAVAGSVTGSTVTHDAYVTLEVAGVSYKFMLGS